MDGLSRLRFVDAPASADPAYTRSSGVPLALADHPVARTRELGLATEVTSWLLGPSMVTVQESQERSARGFECTLHAIRLLDVTMAYLDYRVPTRIAVPHPADCFTVHMTTAGYGLAEIGEVEHEITSFSALVASPGTGYRLRLAEDSPQLVIRIERPALERHLTRMLGRSLDDQVVFDPIADLTEDQAVRWHGALQILSSEIVSRGSLVRQGIGAGALEELIISTLLYIQPNTYSDRLREPVGPSGRVAVRRAIEYIEHHLAEHISMADLADYVQMSSRSIQAGFREDLDTTPVSFIRDCRLDRVRQELIAATPGVRLTVTEVAEHWGFSHLGNFSGLYRKRFGEPPSQTLRH